MQAPASLAGSGVAGESGRVVGLKRSSVWRSPRVSANSRARGSTAEDPSLVSFVLRSSVRLQHQEPLRDSILPGFRSAFNAHPRHWTGVNEADL